MATRPELVDWMGRPIDLSLLTKEKSAPTLAGARSIVGGHPAQGLTPQRLASLLRSAETGDARAYMELAEQMEEKDLHYLGVLGTRKRQVCQLEITVEAASDDADDQANAELLRDWLNRDTLQDDLFDVMDAVGKGFSVVELIWATSERQWWPERLEWVDPRWIEFDRVTGRVPQLIGEDGIAAPLAPFGYVYHQVKAKSGLPIRGGLARPVSWAWMFKNYTVKDWVAFAEAYGMPIRLGKYDSSATPADKRALLRAVAEIGVDAAAIVPKSMDLEFVDAKHGNSDGALFEKGADWFDRQVSKAVLGQTATTDAEVGGLGSGEEHGKVREDIETADKNSLAATLNRDIGRPMQLLNRGQPKSGKFARFVIGRAESWDAGKMMPAVKSFVEMGGRVGASTIRDRLGLPDPDDEEELLTAPAAASAPAEEAASEAPGNPRGAPTPAKSRRRAPAGRLKPLTTGKDGEEPAAHAAQPEPAAEPDAIDLLADEAAADWELLTGGLSAPIEQLLASCSSLQEFRDRLAQSIGGMDVTALQQRLARSGFAARLAGAAAQDLADTEENR